MASEGLVETMLGQLRRFIARLLRVPVDHEHIIRYLYYEVSELREAVRHLLAERGDRGLAAKTKASFDYQWGNANEAPYLITNASYRQNVSEVVVHFTRLPREWFSGKWVLDAGCGSGRFTYGLAKLGARVDAVDVSANGLSVTETFTREFGERVVTKQVDLLKPLPLEPVYDLVWCYGVLHHTGNTFLAFRNVARMVKPKGFLFLMVYGEPRIDKPHEFAEYAEYGRLRHSTRNLSLQQRLTTLQTEPMVTDVHGWFDAISPRINDTYSYEEIEEWLLASGFGNIQRTIDNPNHHVIATRIL